MTDKQPRPNYARSWSNLSCLVERVESIRSSAAHIFWYSLKRYAELWNHSVYTKKAGYFPIRNGVILLWPVFVWLSERYICSMSRIPVVRPGVPYGACSTNGWTVVYIWSRVRMTWFVFANGMYCRGHIVIVGFLRVRSYVITFPICCGARPVSYADRCRSGRVRRWSAALSVAGGGRSAQDGCDYPYCGGVQRLGGHGAGRRVSV